MLAAKSRDWANQAARPPIIQAVPHQRGRARTLAKGTLVPERHQAVGLGCGWLAWLIVLGWRDNVLSQCSSVSVPVGKPLPAKSNIATKGPDPSISRSRLLRGSADLQAPSHNMDPSVPLESSLTSLRSKSGWLFRIGKVVCEREMWLVSSYIIATAGDQPVVTRQPSYVWV